MHDSNKAGNDCSLLDLDITSICVLLDSQITLSRMKCLQTVLVLPSSKVSYTNELCYYSTVGRPLYEINTVLHKYIIVVPICQCKYK